MKKFLASAILVFAASQSYAVCPAAPVASPSELVLQLKKQGDGTAAWAPTSQVSSTVEGSMVWDDTNDAIAYCDGTNWVTLSGGSGPAGLNDLTDAKADTTSVFVGSSAGADDDGTDNENTAIGISSLSNNTSGYSNTATGYQALLSNTVGRSNTAIGGETLKANTSGIRNTAIGWSALSTNTTGSENTAHGFRALFRNTTGANNTAIGFTALYENSTGSNNTATGFQAGHFLTDGSSPNATGTNSVFLGSSTRALADGQTNQIVIGHNATGAGDNSVVLGNDNIVLTALKGDVGVGNTSPSSTLHVSGDIQVGNDGATCIGQRAGAIRYNGGSIEFCNGSAWRALGAGATNLDELTDATNDTTKSNLFIGHDGGSFGGQNEDNAAVGHGALASLSGTGTNPSGERNAALGTNALQSLTEGVGNTAIGAGSLSSDTNGNYNTAVGAYALRDNTPGDNNGSSTAVGAFSMQLTTTGRNNTAVGHNSLGQNLTGSTNVAIGHNAGYWTSAGNPLTSVNSGVFVGLDTRSLNDNSTNEIVIGRGARGAGNNSVTIGNDTIQKTILKGDIGIGNTSPSTTLHVDVAGADTDGLWLRQTSGYPASGMALLTLDSVYTGARDLVDFRSGGTSRFSISSAGLTSIGDAGNVVVEPGGDVGIGLTNPETKLHVLHATGVSDYNTVLFPIRVKNAAWTNSQMTGVEFWNGVNKSVPTSRIISQMAGSGADGENLIFQTQPSSGTNPNPNNPTTKVVITADGNVGIGTTSPSDTLHVAGTALADGWNVPSDRRLKSEIAPIENALDSIEKLVGASFTYKKGDRQSIGLIAQDVEEIFPTAVKTNRYTNIKSVDYNQLIAPLVEAVKELSTKNKALEARIKTLEAAE